MTEKPSTGLLGGLNHNFILKDSGYSNYESTVDMPRHRWYYYKEGFSPNLVLKAIEKTGIGKDDVIIDPFDGSGTTTLTASLGGHKSIGIEVNPFTSFLSDVKTRNANVDHLKTLGAKLANSSQKGSPSPLVGFSTFSWKKGLDKWLFKKSILNSFEGGWQFTKQIPSSNIRKLLRLALISAAMQNCNATRDGKCLRYRESWKTKTFDKASFSQDLISMLSQISLDIEEKRIEQKPVIVNGDCRVILKSSKKIKPFKLCVTSPPYLNTFDYTDIYRPELFLGKFVDNNKELRHLRLNTVRSHIQVNWNRPTMKEFGELYSSSMKHIEENNEDLMDKKIPLMIQAYFEDMFNILKSLKAHAAEDAQVWIVVSNSAYAGLEVPVDLIIGEIGSRAGWYLKEIGVLRYIRRRKTNHSANITHLRESVIIFSKSKI